MKRFVVLTVIFSMCFMPTSFAGDAEVAMLLKNMQQQMTEMKAMMESQKRTIEFQGKQIDILKSELGQTSVPVNYQTAEGEATKLPGWMEGLEYSGDIRLRYEGTSQSSGGVSGGAGVDNDRNRFRYRFRYGFTKTFNEEMKVGFKLASGDVDTITSRNETFDTQFGLKGIGIDQTYATYTPNWAKKGFVEKLEITGGKFKNVFREGSSGMMWDSDVTPEGLYEKIDFNVYESDDIDLDASLLLGQLVVEEGSTSGNSEDAELFVYQGGFKYKLHNILENPISVKNLFSYYDYNDITSPGNFGTARGNFTDNGGLSAEDFDIIEIYNEIGFQPKDLPPVKLVFDWAKNVSESAIGSLGGGQDKSWLLWGQLGKASKKGTWQLGAGYYWVEANALPGVFTNSDLGTVDTRGGMLKGSYALTDYLKFDASFYFNNRITGDSLTDDRENKIVQLNLIWAI